MHNFIISDTQTFQNRWLNVWTWWWQSHLKFINESHYGKQLTRIAANNYIIIRGCADCLD